jgi:hypothetical protein
MLFKKKDLSQIVAEEKILRCIEKEAELVEKGEDDFTQTEVHCRNIKALSEAYASLNGWY